MAYNYQKSRVRKSSPNQWTHRTFWHVCLDGGWEVISMVSEAHVCGQDVEPGRVNLTSLIQNAHSCHSQGMMSERQSTWSNIADSDTKVILFPNKSSKTSTSMSGFQSKGFKISVLCNYLSTADSHHPAVCPPHVAPRMQCFLQSPLHQAWQG